MEAERSRLFKFFYVLLVILTFPVYVVLFLFRHLLLSLFLVLSVLGGLIYYPITQGVELGKVLDWYKKEYFQLKISVVESALKNGKADFIPERIIKDVENVKADMELEAKEANMVKGENFNTKVDHTAESEDLKKDLMARKKGFKKVNHNNSSESHNIVDKSDVTVEKSNKTEEFDFEEMLNQAKSKENLEIKSEKSEFEEDNQVIKDVVSNHEKSTDEKINLLEILDVSSKK